MGYKLEGPMTPSSGSITLLEQRTELREIFSYIDYLTIKDMNKEVHRARYGAGYGVFMPSPP